MLVGMLGDFKLESRLCFDVLFHIELEDTKLDVYAKACRINMKKSKASSSTEFVQELVKPMAFS